MKRYIKSNRSYLDDQMHYDDVKWSEYDVDICKDILKDYQFVEIVEDTFQSKVFNDSNLNEDGGKYVCMLSFRIPEKVIRCRVEDRFETSSRVASETTVRNKGDVYSTFSSAIQWLNSVGLPSNIASQILYDIPVM